MLMFNNEDIESIRSSTDNFRMLKLAHDYGINPTNLSAAKEWRIWNTYGIGPTFDIFDELLRLVFHKFDIKRIPHNEDEAKYAISGGELSLVLQSQSEYTQSIQPFITRVNCDYSMASLNIEIIDDTITLHLEENYYGYHSQFLEHLMKMAALISEYLEKDDIHE
ncbi:MULTISPECIES: hypothetical protein [Paenibacillus]|uniref:Uncharacterized protein n=1 Tax=Paenibacillus vandeheii TaxID=3035917 RepID=A0ABT8JFF8_9BACL|nr:MULTISPECIES: hypothetical protein [Paenibacillus]KGP81957.1 hypothetical protein P364_0114135 [Paenibacillus sp. MAEPY2]KGP86043.1 hypothetical protein P363_0119610 [Paenibacillus sp. MAEPY1]MDN4603873.1 hypothetical protein [Paenibacillus vandeheii]